MPRRKTTPEPKKKASGANIEEWQRGTVARKLRLSPLAARALDEGAERSGLSLSGYVERLVMADIPEAD
jgi:hypothetical protein